MANLKSLAKDTAIYGLSSIAGRFINYLLVPIQTTAFAAAGGQYGVVTNIYAYTALLLVVLTYGMETTFFRYVNKTEENPQTVYSTVLMSVGGTAALFIALVFAFLPQIATFMKYPDHQSWVAVMFVCVAIDAFKCIPFAYLRYQKKALKFAALQLVNIILNIVLNMLYLLVLPALHGGRGHGVLYQPRLHRCGSCMLLEGADRISLALRRSAVASHAPLCLAAPRARHRRHP